MWPSTSKIHACPLAHHVQLMHQITKASCGTMTTMHGAHRHQPTKRITSSGQSCSSLVTEEGSKGGRLLTALLAQAVEVSAQQLSAVYWQIMRLLVKGTAEPRV